MSDPMVLGGKLLSLLDETAVVATYKPALLMSIIDCVTETGEVDSIPVERLAERAIELYWPQTTPYPTTNDILRQSQSSQAAVIRDIGRYQEKTGTKKTRSIPDSVRSGKDWAWLVRRVELTLAAMPISYFHSPFEPFMFTFDWPGKKKFRVGSYDSSSREVHLMPGVAQTLISLGPLLRPFIVRWWSEKAAKLNPMVEKEMAPMLNLEKFLFGHDRETLDPIAEGLLDLQYGRCFYCDTGIGKNREIDHFVPWSHSRDDGLFNLVAACRACNGKKSAIFAGPDFLEALADRNEKWIADLDHLAKERSWPADRVRSARITRSAYLGSPPERPLWLGRDASPATEPLSGSLNRVRSLIDRFPV